jgi:hypothetical protein
LNDSAAGTKLFFDSYGQDPLEFNTNDVSATIGFFESKGFASDAALVVSTVLLKQAKIDDTPIFKILDTLKDFNGLTTKSTSWGNTQQQSHSQLQH